MKEWKCKCGETHNKYFCPKHKLGYEEMVLDKRLLKPMQLIFAFAFAFFLIFGTLIIIAIPYPVTIEGMFVRPSMHLYGEFGRNNSIVVNITKFCNVEAFSFSNKVDCAVQQVNGFFNYTFDNRTKILKTPDQTAQTGGVCRDYAVMYDSIFKNMGFETDFVFLHQHIFNVVWSDDGYCTVDQTKSECVDYA